MLKLNFDVPKKFGAVVIMGLLVGLLAITAVACGSDDEEEVYNPNTQKKGMTRINVRKNKW